MPPIWKISTTASAESEDLVAELLSAAFNQSASIYTDAESGATTVSVYCDKRPTDLAARRAALRDGLQRIRGCGLDVGTGRISLRKLRHENWAESWKRHFKPLIIGDALLIKPSWSKRRSRRGQAVVVIDPGLSFGTGQHPTTRFCLRELVQGRAMARQRPSASSFLDIGTGSGILAIAAAKLGYSPVGAFDFDPEAVRVARANAQANRVSSKIRISRADVKELRYRSMASHDIVCANLISTLLISERLIIAAWVKRDGLLVLAGILRSEFREVQSAYESLGFRLVASQAEKEWRSGSFRYACHFNWRNET